MKFLINIYRMKEFIKPNTLYYSNKFVLFKFNFTNILKVNTEINYRTIELRI